MCLCVPVGVDIALFEVFKQELFDDAERKGAPPPNLSLLVAGMVSSSIAQVRHNGDLYTEGE